MDLLLPSINSWDPKTTHAFEIQLEDQDDEHGPEGQAG